MGILAHVIDWLMHTVRAGEKEERVDLGLGGAKQESSVLWRQTSILLPINTLEYKVTQD
jgi:hypothetical protein